MCMCFIERMKSQIVIKKVKIIGTKMQIGKTIVCTACHRYRLNSNSFLISGDMVRTFNICKFFTQNNCFNMFLHCIDQTAVNDSVD